MSGIAGTIHEYRLTPETVNALEIRKTGKVYPCSVCGFKARKGAFSGSAFLFGCCKGCLTILRREIVLPWYQLK